MTLGESINALLNIWRRAQLLSETKAVDPTRGGLHTGITQSRNASAPSFGRDLPISVDLERTLARLAAVYRARLDEAERGVVTASAQRAVILAEAQLLSGALGLPESRVGQPRTGERFVRDGILEAEGIDPTTLGFLYGKTTRAIQDMRRRAGLDPDTGEKVKRNVLTAPARDTLKAIQNGEGEG